MPFKNIQEVDIKFSVMYKTYNEKSHLFIYPLSRVMYYIVLQWFSHSIVVVVARACIALHTFWKKHHSEHARCPLLCHQSPVKVMLIFRMSCLTRVPVDRSSSQTDHFFGMLRIQLGHWWCRTLPGSRAMSSCWRHSILSGHSLWHTPSKSGWNSTGMGLQPHEVSRRKGDDFQSRNSPGFSDPQRAVHAWGIPSGELSLWSEMFGMW